MCVTLLGRRDLRRWPRAKVAEKKEDVEDDPPFHAVGLAPGSVYLGTFSGPDHQASHAAVQDSLLRGHSVTLIIRTSLFPYNQSRRMNSVANPPAVFFAMVEEFVAELGASVCWRLPTLSQCMAQMPGEWAE